MSTNYSNKTFLINTIRNSGRIAVFIAIAAVLFYSQTGLNAQQKEITIDRTAKTKVINKISALLIDDYIFLDKAKEMKKLIKSKLNSGGYDSLDNPGQFAMTLTTDLQSISHDKHLRIGFNPDAFKRLIEPATGPGDNEDKLFVEQMKRENYGFKKVEIMGGNIGYIDFRNFAPADFSKEKVASVMNFVSSSDALIFDIRMNGGGSPDGVRLICSYLFGKEPVHLNDLYFRNRDETEEFWTLRKVDGVKMPDVPVYVLTSQYTFSGAEEFAYNLKNLHRATIVGETTGGGANPGRTHPLAEGFVGFIPNGRAINPYTKTNWEGTGVSPDVQISSEKALEKAEVLALNKLADNSANEQMKKSYKWLSEGLEAALNTEHPDIKTLETYAGKYEDRTISVSGSSLYYQRFSRSKTLMTPMGNDTFMFKDITYFRIKFERDSNGNVTGLTGMYDDGHTDKSKKTN